LVAIEAISVKLLNFKSGNFAIRPDLVFHGWTVDAIQPDKTI